MENRETIEAEIASLRQKRGAALLQGKKFDDSSITALNQKLEALDDANAFQRELDRQESAKRHAAAVVAINREIEDLKSASAKALADSRAAYHAGAAAMRT